MTRYCSLCGHPVDPGYTYAASELHFCDRCGDVDRPDRLTSCWAVYIWCGGAHEVPRHLAEEVHAILDGRMPLNTGAE